MDKMPVCVFKIDQNNQNLSGGLRTIIVSMTQKDNHLVNTVAPKQSYLRDNILLFKIYQVIFYFFSRDLAEIYYLKKSCFISDFRN